MSHGSERAYLLNFVSSVLPLKSHSRRRSRFAALCAMLAAALFGTLNLANGQTKTSRTTTLAVT
ncbi:MAG: hypothetical protein WAL75_17110 [Terracidiphilus sp.]